jgi:hypothetical protein
MIGRYALYGDGLDKPKIDRNNKKLTAKIPGFSVNRSIYRGGYEDPNFIEDLFSAIAYVVWVTDQRYNAEHKDQVGIIVSNGFNPSDVSPLRPQANGKIFNFGGKYDLRGLLPRNPDPKATILLGPDGLFGPDADSVLTEIAKTDKIFKKPIPQQARPLFTRLLNGVSTDAIRQAKAKRASGVPQASQTQSAGYDKSTLSGDAQFTLGMVVTKPIRTLGEGWGAFNPTLATSKLLKNIAKFGLARPLPTGPLPTGPITHGQPEKPKSKRRTASDEKPKSKRRTASDEKPTPAADNTKPKETKPKAQTAGDDKPVDEAESDNTLYWVLGITSGIALLGGAYIIIQKNKSNQI